MTSMTPLKKWFLQIAGCGALLACTFSSATQDKADKGISAAPTFSRPSGVYTNRISLQLLSKAPSTVIRYTLDGSEPKETSAAYAESVAINGSVLVKAKAFTPGLKPSATVSQTYTLLDESLVGFRSNLPLVIINTFGGYVTHETKTPVSVRVINASGGRSSLLGAADFDGRGTINTRGRSSLEFPKHSLTLHTKDDSGEDAKVPILGLPKESAWVLYAPYSDKTLMRDALAYELSNKMGHYAPRTRFVEVFVSRSGDRLSRKSYFGVYVFEEKIKRGKDRVNIEKIKPEDKTEPGITGGYIFKKDHMDKGEPGFRTSRGSHFFYVEPKAEEITATQRSWLIGHLNQFERALYGSNFKDPARGYAAYIDVDSFIDQHWIVELTKNVDGIRFSNFLHKDRGGKIKMDPIWDWNLSFGNANGKQGWLPENWYWPQLGDSEYLWFRRLFQDPDFEQKYVDRWGVLRTNIFASSNLLARVDELAKVLQEPQARNFKRWPILGRFVNPNYYVGQSYEDEIRWMKDWIRARMVWVDKQFLPAPSFSLKEGSKDSPARLTVRARTGKIYYTLDGTDPRSPGGEVSARAHPYGSPLPLGESSQVFARARDGDRWSSPTVARFPVNAITSRKRD